MAASTLWEATTFKGLIAIIDDPKTTVAKGCQAVEECINANRDNLRGFFEQCFAPLVARVFGYSGPSWLAAVVRSGRDADARALRRLLSPSGPLFTAVYSADADGSTRFHFPRQRLPAHTQMLLATPAGTRALAAWPQYAGALGEGGAAAGKGHIHVSVFQYFCYWFAFYAIKGGDLGGGRGPGLGGGGGALGASAASTFGSSVRRAADALHLTRGRDADSALRNPYIALLRQMLTELAPRPAGAPPAPLASPRRGAALPAPALPYFRGTPGKGGADAASRGLVFYSTLLEFWLKDGDEPVPSGGVGGGAGDRAGGGSGGYASPVAPLWATSYEPPSEELLEAVGELVRYVTVAAAPGAGGRAAPAAVPAQAGAPWLPVTPVLTIQTGGAAAAGRAPGAALAGPPRLGAAAQPGAQALSRQLYRFFHRAFSMWPDQRTIKPLLRVFLALVAPWGSPPVAAPGAGEGSPGALASNLTAHMSGLVHRVGRADAPRGGLAGAPSGAGPSASAGAFSPEWEAHVLSNLPFYLDLFPLFLERSISRVSVRGETAAADVQRVFSVLESAPALVDLLRSVERDFNRCAASQPRRAEGPHAELLPWLIEQAGDWAGAAAATALGDAPAAAGRSAPSYAMFTVAGDRCAGLAAKDLLDLSGGVLKADAQGRLRRCLEAILPLSDLAAVAPAAAAAAAAAAEAADALPRLPRSSWRDVRYRGDALERPVASYEVAPLVRIAVAVSRRANAALELDRPWAADEELPENRVAEALAEARRRGWRVDLRPLADLRNLFWIPVVWWAARVLLRAAWMVAVAIATGALE